MRYCPICKAEYEDWATECADCEISLADSEHLIRSKESVREPINKFATVFEAKDPLEAHMIRGLLESNKFPCKMLGAYENLYAQALPIQIQVPSELEHEAKELIKIYQESHVSDLELG